MLFRRLRMETKKLLVPAQDIERPIQIMRGHIRTYFEKQYPNSEIIRVQFMEKKCFVQLERPILEYSSHGRLQFHHEGQMIKYDLVLRNSNEVAEA
jgi:hypothetical protein